MSSKIQISQRIFDKFCVNIILSSKFFKLVKCTDPSKLFSSSPLPTTGWTVWFPMLVSEHLRGWSNSPRTATTDHWMQPTMIPIISITTIQVLPNVASIHQQMRKKPVSTNIYFVCFFVSILDNPLVNFLDFVLLYKGLKNVSN